MKRVVWVTLGTSILGVFMLIIRASVFQNVRYLYLIWNMILATIPLLLSLVAVNSAKNKEYNKILMGVLFGVWLFFYPNAPYMVTDLIHFSKVSYYELFRYGTVYNKDFLVWFDFSVNCIFIANGILTGLISLKIMQNVVEYILNKKLSIIFVGITIILSSFAIYIGRFMRFNTWDIVFNPVVLIISIINELSINSIGFVLIFSLMLSIFYTLFSTTCDNRKLK